MSREVPTQDAENAMNRINQTLALHIHDRRALPQPWRGRLRGTPGVVRTDASRYLVLPHLVAVAEEFSRRLLVGITEPQVPQDRQVLKLLWARAEDQAEGSWPEHLKAWKEWHRVPLAEEGIYQDLRPFVDARNAIMHGAGELTRKQRRGNQEASLRGAWKNIGIDLLGTRLIVHDKAVTKCADACKAFVKNLDLRVQKLS